MGRLAKDARANEEGAWLQRVRNAQSLLGGFSSGHFRQSLAERQDQMPNWGARLLQGSQEGCEGWQWVLTCRPSRRPSAPLGFNVNAHPNSTLALLPFTKFQKL